MSQHFWDLLIPCLFTLIIGIFGYYAVFLKMKFDITALKEKHEKIEASIRLERKELGDRFDAFEEKLEQTKMLIINTIINNRIPSVAHSQN